MWLCAKPHTSGLVTSFLSRKQRRKTATTRLLRMSNWACVRMALGRVTVTAAALSQIIPRRCCLRLARKCSVSTAHAQRVAAATVQARRALSSAGPGTARMQPAVGRSSSLSATIRRLSRTQLGRSRAACAPAAQTAQQEPVAAAQPRSRRAASCWTTSAGGASKGARVSVPLAGGMLSQYVPAVRNCQPPVTRQDDMQPVP